MDIEPIYAALVDGTGEAPDLDQHGHLLFRRALEDTRNPDPDARLGALRVAASIGPDLSLPVIRALVDDSDPRVRTWAFNQAVAAREKGVAVLRDAAHGTDGALVAAALDLLCLLMDRASAGVGRRGLDNTDARVRLAAARLLGRVAGPAVTVQLRDAQSDTDPAVRQAATEALQRIAGALDKGDPDVWWDETVPGSALPSPPQGDAGAPDLAWTARAGTPDPESLPATPEATDEPEDAPALPVPVQKTPDLPVAPAPVAEVEWDGEHAALPATMPNETRALVRLLGMLSPTDRTTVVPLIAGKPDLGDLLGSWRPGGDVALGRGLALAAAGLQRNVAVSKIRQMTGDPAPGVRAAAAEAIGVLGAASTLPPLAQLLADDEPFVQVAAIRALVDIAVRIDRKDYVRDQISQLGTRPSPVGPAVAEGLQALDA